MPKSIFLMAIMIIIFGCSSAPKNTPDEKSEEKIEEKTTENNIVDPEVFARVEGMGKYLRGLKKFEVNANTTFDIVLENNQKTEFEANIRYVVYRPNKFFAEIKSDRKHRKYYFDGKKFTIYSPLEKLYGELPVEGTVSDLVKKLNQYGIEVPLSDLFVWGTEEAKAQKITSAIFLNEEKKANELDDHFAIRQDKIDWQVWIRKGDRPLPKKVLYELNDDSARPKMSSTLNWDIEPDFGSTGFDFKPPKGSHKIKINPARKEKEK